MIPKSRLLREYPESPYDPTRGHKTVNEIGLIGEKCFAEYDPGLMSKAVGLREFERWRVGNGIVEIWEGKPQRPSYP